MKDKKIEIKRSEIDGNIFNVYLKKDTPMESRKHIFQGSIQEIYFFIELHEKGYIDIKEHEKH